MLEFPTRPGAISQPEQTQHLVRAKCEYFTEVQLWPLRTKLDPGRWLKNFLPAEEEHAVCLLSSFLYFSEAMVLQLFESAFQALSLHPMFTRCTFLKAQGQWRAFFDNALITHVTGERPNSTDSGYAFLRMARQHVGIQQERIGLPVEIANRLIAEGPRPVVFVDDFVGSGRQCVATWKRPMPLSNGRTASFEKLASIHGSSFFYCPLISTERGLRRLQQECPGLTVSCPHVIGDRYSALTPNSLIWSDHLRSGARDFLFGTSKRAGIPDGLWQGFDGLALSIGFAHSIPDATLPIIYWEQNGWHPLIRRT